MCEAIWAQSINNIIGNNNELPWKIKEDMHHFVEITSGKSVIMGRNTWDGLYKKPLSNRENIVVSSREFTGIRPDFAEKTIADAINRASKTPILIGGAKMYEEGLKFVNKIFLTIINEKYDGNVYAPKISNDFAEISTKIAYTNDNIKLEFKEYERKK